MPFSASSSPNVAMNIKCLFCPALARVEISICTGEAFEYAPVCLACAKARMASRLSPRMASRAFAELCGLPEGKD